MVSRPSQVEHFVQLSRQADPLSQRNQEFTHLLITILLALE